MSTPVPPDLALPTVDLLHVSLPPSIALDAPSIANTWFSAFATALSTPDPDVLLDLFLCEPDAFWRDVLALTGDLRTFRGHVALNQFFRDALASSSGEKAEEGGMGAGITNLALDPRSTLLVRPYPDLVFIQGIFGFSTPAGLGTGVFRLVPVPGGEWKAYTVFTALDGLHGVSENIEREDGGLEEDGDREVEVAIVGGGHCGLGLAARLKALGVRAVVLERSARVGDGWRGRYEALTLQDPVWYDHLPYIPFPASWPVYATGTQLADWLENYACALALDVQTSTTVTRATQDPVTKRWTLTLRRSGKEGVEEETVKTMEVKVVVFAVGWGGGMPFVPEVPGRASFAGEVLHSSEFKSAREYAGKKVLVVGAGTSAHDVAADCCACGVDATMYQRSPTYVMSANNGFKILFGDLYFEHGPPTELADLLNVSLPNYVLHLLAQRKTGEIAEADREILDGLRARGFMLSAGMGGSGVFLQTLVRGGGYYLDVGAARLIAEGKIKLKTGGEMEGFEREGIRFEDGEVERADVVVFATGYTTARDPLAQICGEQVADAVAPVWGLDSEGELRGVWREGGVEGLYVMMGNLALSRIYSKYLALQIKGRAMGVLPSGGKAKSSGA